MGQDYDTYMLQSFPPAYLSADMLRVNELAGQDSYELDVEIIVLDDQHYREVARGQVSVKGCHLAESSKL